MPGEATIPFDLSHIGRVGLADVIEHAAQLTRVDRKYLVGREVAETLVGRIPDGFRLLAIDDRCTTSYASVYFDTLDLDACRGHVQRRRRRWKIRSRLYVEDRLCRMEVKTRDGRGRTAKRVSLSDPSRHGMLEGAEALFVAETLAECGIELDVRALAPSMQIDYRRVTFADTGRSLRVTLDWDVTCRLDGGRAWIDPACVLIETKGDIRPSEVDRRLAALGARPRSFSKYVAAASLLRDDLPDNDVRRFRGRELHAVAVDATTELTA